MPRRWSSRSPRRPDAMSYSSATADRIAATAASIADSASSARPRLVCSTVPVRLKTGRRLGRASISSRAPALVSTASGPSAAARFARNSASTSRTALTTAGRPKRSTRLAAGAARITSSTEGSRRDTAVAAFAITRPHPHAESDCCAARGQCSSATSRTSRATWIEVRALRAASRHDRLYSTGCLSDRRRGRQVRCATGACRGSRMGTACLLAIQGQRSTRKSKVRSSARWRSIALRRARLDSRGAPKNCGVIKAPALKALKSLASFRQNAGFILVIIA